jgi:parallel beta-helix repeat protein
MNQLMVAIIAAFFSVAAHSEVITVSPGDTIQTAIDHAKPGDTVRVLPGVYTQTVYIDKDNLRLTGAMDHGRWAVLDGEGVRNDGVLVASHGVTIEWLHIMRFRGNGIMMQGGNNFTIVNNWVEGPSFYGIFPQYGKNGLVAHNVISGVADAGIYMGMCENVDILDNDSSGNLSGIEVENSTDMLVEGNYAHGNTMGVQVSLVKGLPIKQGERTVVRNNYLVENNKSPPSDSPLLADAPEGVGLLIKGTHAARIENNIFTKNVSSAILVTDATEGFPDPKADPYADRHEILRNVFIDNGREPQGAVKHLLAQIKLTAGPDLLVAGRGHGNCLLDKASVSSLGSDSWEDCQSGATTADVKTVRLAEPVPSVHFTLQQRGRLTYLAVCTGCHSFNNRLIGPPMVAARALYIGKPQALADWMAHPVKRRADYPEMPAQSYIPPEVRLEIARYILGNPEQ